jgi:hypothetical protein
MCSSDRWFPIDEMSRLIRMQDVADIASCIVLHAAEVCEAAAVAVLKKDQQWLQQVRKERS